MKPPPSKTGRTRTGNVGEGECVYCKMKILRTDAKHLWRRLLDGQTDCLNRAEPPFIHDVVLDLPDSLARTDVERWLDA